MARPRLVSSDDGNNSYATTNNNDSNNNSFPRSTCLTMVTGSPALQHGGRSFERRKALATKQTGMLPMDSDLTDFTSTDDLHVKATRYVPVSVSKENEPVANNEGCGGGNLYPGNFRGAHPPVGWGAALLYQIFTRTKSTIYSTSECSLNQPLPYHRSLEYSSLVSCLLPLPPPPLFLSRPPNASTVQRAWR